METTTLDADEIPEELFFFEQMSSQGDIKHTWNPKKPEEVREAQLMFEALIAKGFRAFTMKRGGLTGDLMNGFDPTARRVLFVPPMQGGLSPVR